MKDYKPEPVIGPTEDKSPTTMCIKHDDMPGLMDANLGDRVKFIVTGKVTSNRAADKFANGDATIEVQSIENAEPVKKENAATMHLDKLKSKLPKKEETEVESPEEEKSKDEEKD
jgi:hypothetical protein